jgi:hypothetical protein
MLMVPPGQIEKIKTFLASYQQALRTLVAQVPNDGYILPRGIVAAIGTCDVWPCTDAAIALTYTNTSNASIDVKEQVNQGTAQFLKEGEPFAYFDEMGRRGPMRLQFAFPKKNPIDPRPAAKDFLFDKFSADDLITWPPDEKSEDFDYYYTPFFAPKFSRISVLGWNAHLGDPVGEALKDFRKAYALKNLNVE